MKVALVMMVLTGLSTSVEAGVLRTYDLESTEIGWTDLPTCHASDRMLRDVHRIKFYDDDRWTIRINGLEWDVEAVKGGSQELKLTFHHHHDQLIWLQMELLVDDRYIFGTYTLYGVTRDGGTPCADKVEIRGIRR